MKKVFLWWLITGSKGGENRIRIIRTKIDHIMLINLQKNFLLIIRLLGIIWMF